MRDVVISVRVSTDEQAESGYSLAAQERAGRAYCELHGWRVVEVVIDDGYSGTLDPSRRPGLARALDLLRTKRANTLVIHKLDRLARSVRIVNELLDEFQRRSWGLVAVADSIDLTTPMGWAIVQMQAVWAELYIKNLSAETKKGWKERAQQGGWVGHPPLGYERDGTTLRPTADAEAVLLAYELYASDVHSYDTIADALNERGCRTLDARNGRRGLFGRESVRTILRNRAYLGYTSSGGVEFQGAHPPLVSTELWERCASIREARERRPTATRLTSSVDVFPQRVYCAACGGRCHYYTSGQPGSRNRYYRCVSRRAAGERRTDCQEAGVPITAVEQQMIELIASIKITDELRTVLHEEAARAVAQARPASEIDRTALEQKLARLGEVYADGLIGREEYQRRVVELRRQLDAPAMPAAGPDLDAVLTVLADIPAIVRAATPTELRAIVAPMVSHIWVENRRAVAITPTAQFEDLFIGIWRFEVVDRCPTGLDAPLTTYDPAVLWRADRSRLLAA